MLTFSFANWENQATMGQETGGGISGGYEGNFQTNFLAKFKIKEPRFQKQHLRAAFGCGCCLLPHMLPYAFTSRVEQHGDFRGVGTMAWLGLASAGVGG